MSVTHAMEESKGNAMSIIPTEAAEMGFQVPQLSISHKLNSDDLKPDYISTLVAGDMGIRATQISTPPLENSDSSDDWKSIFRGFGIPEEDLKGEPSSAYLFRKYAMQLPSLLYGGRSPKMNKAFEEELKRLERREMIEWVKGLPKKLIIDCPYCRCVVSGTRKEVIIHWMNHKNASEKKFHE